MSRLLMPMGFTAVLGGTMAIVGSSTLILLNDLILTSNKALPAEQQMETRVLFSVTPIGLALVITGILYFVLAGRFVLPKTKSESSTIGSDAMQYFQDVYGVNLSLSELLVKDGSKLIGLKFDDVETAYRVRIIATKCQGDVNRAGPGALARDVDIRAGMVLGVVADPADLARFVDEFGLKKRTALRTFAGDLSSTKTLSRKSSFLPVPALLARVRAMSGCARPTDWR